MLKRFLSMSMAILLCISLATSAFAQEIDVDAKVDSLTPEGLLELASDLQGDLSRGDFSAMLVLAAALEEKDIAEREDLPQDLEVEAPYAKAVVALLDRGIMKGTSAATVAADSPITGFQALVLIARTLGIPEGPNLYDLLVQEGIAQEGMDLSDKITAEAASELLLSAFGTHRETKALMEEVSARNSMVKSVRFKGDMIIKATMDFMPELEGQSVEIKSTMESGISMKSGALHQIVEMDMSPIVPEAGIVTMEQYMDRDYIYTSGGDGQWIKIENPVPMVFDEEFMTKQLEINKGIEDLSYYRMLGTEELEGRKVYKVASYSRIEDYAKIYEEMGDVLGAEALELLAESSETLGSMSMRGTQWIGVEDGLVYKADMTILVEMLVQDQPLVMEMAMKVFYYDYDVDFEIVIPEEAKAGKTLEELLEEAGVEVEAPVGE